MTSRAWRLLLAAAAAAALPAGALPATAQTAGACTATFNGIPADQIASISRPLLLGAGDALTFAGADLETTQNAAVVVHLGPASLGRAAAPPGLAQTNFSVSLPLSEVAPYGVGLLHIRGTTDNCTVDAWLRLGGRLPFTTLVGLTGTGLALAGLTGQISALVARRRWSVPLAAAAGVATGVGGAFLGQQFGRLQLSYPALAACIALAVLVGLGLALLLRRRGSPADAADPEERPARPAAATLTRRPADPASVPARSRMPEQPEPAGPISSAAGPEEAPAPMAPAARAAAEPEAPPPAATRPAAGGPAWCYVMTDVEVLHLDDYTRVVATLHPGTWYLTKREVSGWSQVVAGEGVEGWVPRQALHREG